jgi:hypothetical protein
MISTPIYYLDDVCSRIMILVRHKKLKCKVICKFSTGVATICEKKTKFLSIYPYFCEIKEHIKTKYDFNLKITETQINYLYK